MSAILLVGGSTFVTGGARQHSITVHYPTTAPTLHYITLRYINYMTLHYTTLHYTGLHDPTLHYTTHITPPHLQLQPGYTSRTTPR